MPWADNPAQPSSGACPRGWAEPKIEDDVVELNRHGYFCQHWMASAGKARQTLGWAHFAGRRLAIAMRELRQKRDGTAAFRPKR
jgi:hypothetical protein